MATKKKAPAKKRAPGSNGQVKKATTPTAHGQAWERGQAVKCSPNQADPLTTETVANEKL